jgi:cell division protein FtsI/penicillin-binding protein 2
VDAPVLDPKLSPQLAALMEHVLKSEWYAPYSKVPGSWLGGKTGTAQVWDAEHQRWAPNLYNFSCVGFIGRQEGRPDLVVAVKIGEAPPNRNALGQFYLPVTSTELFRRVATDAISTPGLLPVIESSGPVAALGAR